MGIVNNILENHFHIDHKCKKYLKNINIKKHDAVFLISDFKKVLSLGNIKDNFSLFNISDFFKVNKQYLDEFSSVSKNLCTHIQRELTDKGVILTIKYEYLNQGIIIFSFPSTLNFEDFDEFRTILLDLLVKFYSSYIKKDDYKKNKPGQKNNIKFHSELEYDWNKLKDEIVNFVYETIKESKA